MRKLMIHPFVSLLLLAVAALSSASEGAESAASGLDTARAFLAEGRAMDGVLAILDAVDAMPSDASCTDGALALGQTFKFAYDYLLTTAERREVLEEHLIPGSTIIRKVLWLTCFPGFDGLGEAQQRAACTIVSEVLKSDHAVAKMVCLALSV